MATLGNSLFFLGSRLGDSLLVQFSCGIGASALPHGMKEEVSIWSQCLTLLLCFIYSFLLFGKKIHGNIFLFFQCLTS